MLGVIIFNLVIIVSAVILEEFALRNNTTTYTIILEDLELLKNGKKQKILKEVSDLTGREILKYKIRKIDYKKQVAVLDISYKDRSIQL